MKLNRKIILSFVILIAMAIFYRFIPIMKGVYGITPVFAMAVFGGVLFRNDKKWAFALPLVTLFLSDILFQVLYKAGMTPIQGFYDGQLMNYVLLAIVTCIGFFVTKVNIRNVALASLAAPTLFFILSNFAVWFSSAMYPKSLAGLGECYAAGLPFYFPWSLASTLIYSGILFGVFYKLYRAARNTITMHV